MYGLKSEPVTMFINLLSSAVPPTLRDAFDDIVDEISEKFLGMYGIHNVTKSISSNAVFVYIDNPSDLPEDELKEIKILSRPHKLVVKQSKNKENTEHLDKLIK